MKVEISGRQLVLFRHNVFVFKRSVSAGGKDFGIASGGSQGHEHGGGGED